LGADRPEGRGVKRVLPAVLASALLVSVQPAASQAADPSPISPPPCDGFASCAPTQSGLDTSMSRDKVAGLKRTPSDDGHEPIDPAYDGPRHEYATTSGCTNNAPGEAGADAQCPRAITVCSDPAKGPGPLARIWQRTLETGKPPTAWTQVGVTCWTDVAPGSRPTITMAMIERAFHTTPWAKPVITTEPKGNVTLVALDTFYKVNWSSDGFQPNEVEPIDPATMLGFEVDIRPRLDHFTYFFGDGQDFGPTSNEGGVYPSGGITHQYLKAGDYPARVDTTFGGEFRINGGAWAPIPDTVTVPGPPTNVTVKTARAELVNH